MDRAGLRSPKASNGRDPIADAILSAVRSGRRLADEAFDAIYEPRWQLLSSQHWTPLPDAEVAVQWLTEAGARRVLDVGAGVGKLCIYGALITDDVHFVGVEHRSELVGAATRAAARLGVASRVELRHGSIDSIDPSSFDAIYLYNPFAENLSDDPDDVIDRTVELGRDRYQRDVQTIERWLPGLRVGARVVTLHGFGGWLPDSFRPIASRRTGWDVLRLWEKTRPGGARSTAYAETKRR